MNWCRIGIRNELDNEEENITNKKIIFDIQNIKKQHIETAIEKFGKKQFERIFLRKKKKNQKKILKNILYSYFRKSPIKFDMITFKYI